MTAALVAGLCGACREADCDCCDLLVWGGPCDCGCPIGVPGRPEPIVIVLNRRYEPVRLRAKQRSHCQRGHKLSGNNVYTENGSSKRRCWKCRRASWRRYQYRKQRNQGEVA